MQSATEYLISEETQKGRSARISMTAVRFCIDNHFFFHRTTYRKTPFSMNIQNAKLMRIKYKFQTYFFYSDNIFLLMLYKFGHKEIQCKYLKYIINI